MLISLVIKGSSSEKEMQATSIRLCADSSTPRGEGQEGRQGHKGDKRKEFPMPGLSKREDVLSLAQSRRSPPIIHCLSPERVGER